MTYNIIDPIDFFEDGVFSEDGFLKKASEYDWAKFTGKKILVRGCSTVVPPWVYMYITSKLVSKAKTIRYGNEHDNIVVHRS